MFNKLHLLVDLVGLVQLKKKTAMHFCFFTSYSTMSNANIVCSHLDVLYLLFFLQLVINSETFSLNTPFVNLQDVSLLYYR